MNNPRRVCHKFMSHPLFNLFIIFSSSDYTELSEEHSCCTDYARNLNGKRPVRSRRLKPHVIRSRRFHDFTFFCPTDFTDLHRFGPGRSMRFRRFFFIGLSRVIQWEICVNLWDKKRMIVKSASSAKSA